MFSVPLSLSLSPSFPPSLLPSPPHSLSPPPFPSLSIPLPPPLRLSACPSPPPPPLSLVVTKPLPHVPIPAIRFLESRGGLGAIDTQKAKVTVASDARMGVGRPRQAGVGAGTGNCRRDGRTDPPERRQAGGRQRGGQSDGWMGVQRAAQSGCGERRGEERGAKPGARPPCLGTKTKKFSLRTACTAPPSRSSLSIGAGSEILGPFFR